MEKFFKMPEAVIKAIKELLKSKIHFFIYKERKKSGPLMVTDAGSVDDSKRMLQLVLMMFFDSMRDSGASFDDFSTAIKELLEQARMDAAEGPSEDSVFFRLSRKKDK